MTWLIAQQLQDDVFHVAGAEPLAAPSPWPATTETPTLRTKPKTKRHLCLSCEMLRNDILGRYILSRRHSTSCAPSHYPTYACMFGSHSYIAPTLHPIDARARERSCNVSASNAAPVLGRGSGYHARAQPPGHPRYAGDYRRIGEPAGGRANPELPGRVLSHHP